MNPAIAQKLPELLAPIFKIDREKVEDNISMKDLPTWDSLTHMEMIAAIETHFNIDLTMEDILTMTDVKSIKQVLKLKMK